MEWISVNDKLPSYEQDVLFCTKGCLVYCGCRTILTKGNNSMNKSHFVDYRKGRIKTNVTHWMLYPQAPKRIEEQVSFGGYCDEALRTN